MGNIAASPEEEVDWGLVIEIFYQAFFFIVGTPLNIYALRKTSRTLREGGVESRLVALSRQLMIAHIMVLFVYGIWRSAWLFSYWWPHGDLLCRVFSFVHTMPFHLWSNIVAAIAADMLCCIRSPLSNYRTGKTRVRYFIIAGWIVAIVFSFPMMILRGAVNVVVFYNETAKDYQAKSLDVFPNGIPENATVHVQCSPLQEFGAGVLHAWSIFHVVSSFYAPLLLIIFCYCSIGVSLHTQFAARRLIAERGDTSARSSATKTRFLRATIAIVATFALTWLPYQVFVLLRLFCAEDSRCGRMTEKVNFLQAIIVASTCINPFLYRFGSDRRSRASGNGSTFDSTAPVRTVIVACKKESGTAPFLSHHRSSSVR